MQPFHLAIQVRDIDKARAFYTQVLGCTEGRSAEAWVDLDLFGHQLVCHLNPSLKASAEAGEIRNPVDGHGVPVPHFGVVLEMSAWQALADKLKRRVLNSSSSRMSVFRASPANRRRCFFTTPAAMRWNLKRLKIWTSCLQNNHFVQSNQGVLAEVLRQKGRFGLY